MEVGVVRERTRMKSGMGLGGWGVGSRRRCPPCPEKVMRNGTSLAGEVEVPSMEFAAVRRSVSLPFDELVISMLQELSKRRG